MKFLILTLLLTTSVMAQINPDLPAPELLTKKYLEELSQRKLGQSKFVMKDRNWGQQEQQQQQGGDSRDIQESDVFKIGHKNQKELFLLNNYRGFQVVSFKDGLTQPRLISHLPIFNNWSSEMYFLENLDRVLIINTEWDYNSSYWRTNYSTKIYTIDVSNPNAPKSISEKTVPGYLENSRLVGDVLYAITNNGDWSQTKAMITSLKVSAAGLEQIDAQELQGTNQWVRTMNVVQNNKSFYVISSLSNWSGPDLVNVHDITSSKGTIKKVFTAKVRGSISERSGTFIHKDHLFAVSNYTAENQRLRVSVEAFPLKESRDVIESSTVMRASVGDTNGLNASLQDVRVSGNYLYAFWVPANNIDPFDLFDISEPSKGFKHLGQLQFDGWISKAFPINYNNRVFVLGLGWITPPTSENGRRYPQAKLFEIKNTNGVVNHSVVASLTVDSELLWASLNQEDKYFEMMEEAPGVYNILFPVTYMKNWKDGAKIIHADLNNLSVREGASVVGNQGWLRRTFLNNEMSALHAFSDLSLESFHKEDLGTQGIARSVSALELARNIIDFHVLPQGMGLQIVRNDSSVEFRKVSLQDVDAEKEDAQTVMTVKGEYAWHKIKDQTLYAITSFYKARTMDDGPYWSRRFDYANLTTLNLENGETSTSRISLPDHDREYYWFNVEYVHSEKNDFFVIGGQFYVLDGANLKSVSIESGCQYFFNQEEGNFEFLTMNDELYAYNAFDVKPIDGTQNGDYAYSFPFMKKLEVQGQTVTCSPSANTPGKPVLLTDNYLITAEGYENYYDDEEPEYEEGLKFSFIPMKMNTSRSYSLRISEAGGLELVDILNKNISSGLLGKGFITYSPKESRLDLWSINQDGQFISRPQYLSYEGSGSSLIKAKSFGTRRFVFMKNEKLVDVYELKANNSLTQLSVTSTYDEDSSDDSAGNIFDFTTIKASSDLSRFFISQGHFGLSEIKLK